mgnify:CR=1 FL=1
MLKAINTKILLAILAVILAVLSLIMKESVFTIPFTGKELHGQYFLVFLIGVFAVAAFFMVRKFVLKHSRKRIYAYLLFGFLGSAAFISSARRSAGPVLLQVLNAAAAASTTATASATPAAAARVASLPV